jgi:hypothetical protein
MVAYPMPKTIFWKRPLNIIGDIVSQKEIEKGITERRSAVEKL